jgi:hypothetical protein
MIVKNPVQLEPGRQKKVSINRYSHADEPLNAVFKIRQAKAGYFKKTLSAA